jgi:hypothetical protein
MPVRSIADWIGDKKLDEMVGQTPYADAVRVSRCGGRGGPERGVTLSIYEGDLPMS